MDEEIVRVSTNGGTIDSVLVIEVTAGFNEAARSFQLTVAAEAGGEQTASQFVVGANAGAKVTITSNGDLLLTGYVDRYQPMLSRHKGAAEAKIHVAGRGKGQDFVDNSAQFEGGRFQGKTLLEMAQALDLFGVGVHSTVQLEPIPEYQITQGETVFRLLERLGRSQGVTLTGKADGSIEIAGSSTGSNSDLVEGVNIITIKVDHNWSNRHSHIKVLGQAEGPDDEDLEIEGEAEDQAVDRYRPLVIVQDDDTDKKRARKRAKHRRDHEGARSLQAEVTVQGFHDDGGKLWEPGHIVWCESKFAAIAQNMLIERVVFHQERKHGSTAVLSLVDPKAYGAEASKSNESDPSWDEDPNDTGPALE
jgi:prophage tail gpP-like protein